MYTGVYFGLVSDYSRPLIQLNMSIDFKWHNNELKIKYAGKHKQKVK